MGIIIDKPCVSIANCFSKVLSFITCPLRSICKLCSKFFQRPYSLFFLINFLLLITPTIVTTSILCNYHKSILHIGILPFYYLCIIFLCINYIISFQIYYIYQEHSLKFNTENKTRISKDILYDKIKRYILRHKRILVFGSFLLIELILSIFALVYCNKKDYKGFSIIKDGMLFGYIFNVVFIITHVLLYLVLFLVLLCLGNNSCLCALCKKGRLGNNSMTERGEFSYESLHYFIKNSLKCYRVLGLFDYLKLIPLSESTNSQSIEAQNIKTCPPSEPNKP